MDKIKEFIALFWASTFNKIWLALVAVAVGAYFYGTKNGWYKTGWKKYLPIVFVVVAIVSFVLKKFILQKTMPQTGKR